MRYFFRLYFLLVITMLVVSWSLEQLWLAFGPQDEKVDQSIPAIVKLTEHHLSGLLLEQWPQEIERLSRAADLDLSLLRLDAIGGDVSIDKILNNQVIAMRTADRQWWTLKRMGQSDYVLVVSTIDGNNSRSLFEWLLLLMLYGAIALAVMLWVWPLNRDIAKLRRATSAFGDGSWAFSINIKPGSQVYELAESFRTMARRIDRLVQSHKDMSNAVSHEINTPLARMKFEIESVQGSQDIAQIKESLKHIKSDIDQINSLASETLKYAILDRADFALNLARHDFSEILPALVEQVAAQVNFQVEKSCSDELRFKCSVEPNARAVICDIYLLETALKNLLFNAGRYAKEKIHLTFESRDQWYYLIVEDDGPGVPPQDRDKVFDSFSQLKQSSNQKGKFGLGLAIVKRIMEWHDGKISVEDSALGGARFVLCWPSTLDKSQ